MEAAHIRLSRLEGLPEISQASGHVIGRATGLAERAHSRSTQAVALLVTIGLCGLVGCGGGDGANTRLISRLDDGENSPALIKGHAVFGHEVRAIRPCGNEDALWVVDSTQLLWDLHRELTRGAGLYEEMFVVVQGSGDSALRDGFGADYAGTLVVDEVLYVAAEGFGCDLDLDGIHYRASGNEPFWTLLLAESAIQLSRMGEQSRRWNEVRTVSTDSTLTYVGVEPGSNYVEATIADGPCRDSMSGAFFAYRATLVVSGETLYGCALRGAAQLVGERP